MTELFKFLLVWSAGGRVQILAVNELPPEAIVTMS
jgi:hypothetical protein